MNAHELSPQFVGRPEYINRRGFVRGRVGSSRDPSPNRLGQVRADLFQHLTLALRKWESPTHLPPRTQHQRPRPAQPRDLSPRP